jgi:hypothetical protein
MTSFCPATFKLLPAQCLPDSIQPIIGLLPIFLPKFRPANACWSEVWFSLVAGSTKWETTKITGLPLGRQSLLGPESEKNLFFLGSAASFGMRP